MFKKIVYVDIDVTSNYFAESFLAFIEQKTGEKIPMSSWVTYYLTDAPNLPIASEQIAELMHEFHDRPWHLSNLEARAGLVETLNYYKDRIDFKFITSRDPIKYIGMDISTYYWLYVNEIEKDKSKVYFAPKEKITLSQQLNVELAIEDNGEIALNLAQVGIPSLLLDYPWNRSNKFKHNLITRVNCWKPDIWFELNKFLKKN